MNGFPDSVWVTLAGLVVLAVAFFLRRLDPPDDPDNEE